MDLLLIKTFLEVASSGSFAAASERLFVTQSAVSLRVQRLEEQMGRALFHRGKDGVSLTEEGRRLRGFAREIMRNWEEARRSVQAAGRTAEHLAIAIDGGLWPGLGENWFQDLLQDVPDLEIRVDALPVGAAQTPVQLEVEAVLTSGNATILGYRSMPVVEEVHLLLAPERGLRLADLSGRYLRLDWGNEQQRAHEASLPQLHAGQPALATTFLGPVESLLRRTGRAGFVPARLAIEALRQERLFVVEDAPALTNSIWVHWRDGMSEDLRVVAQRTLGAAAHSVRNASASVLSLLGD